MTNLETIYTRALRRYLISDASGCRLGTVTADSESDALDVWAHSEGHRTYAEAHYLRGEVWVAALTEWADVAKTSGSST